MVSGRGVEVKNEGMCNRNLGGRGATGKDPKFFFLFPPSVFVFPESPALGVRRDLTGPSWSRLQRDPQGRQFVEAGTLGPGDTYVPQVFNPNQQSSPNSFFAFALVLPMAAQFLLFRWAGVPPQTIHHLINLTAGFLH